MEQAQSGREGLPRSRVQGMAALLVCTKSLLSFQINAREGKNNFLWVVHKAKAKSPSFKKKKRAEMMKYVSEITYRRALQTATL